MSGSVSENTRLRVVVVEDDARTRRYFAQCVDTCPQLELLGCFGGVAEARAWIARNTSGPDVLLTDLGLPDGSGIDVIRDMLARFPACDALVVSMFGDEEHVLASIEAGALGYVHKDSTPESIADTILELKRGGSPISPGIARRLLQRLSPARTPAIAPATVAAPPAPDGMGLTGRETEILDLLARGFSYVEIADLCKVSRNTVATHVKSLYRKMRVNSRSEAVFEAWQTGVIRPQAGR
jgi:DNA-binding NarL/FixJ family response regulator